MYKRFRGMGARRMLVVAALAVANCELYNITVPGTGYFCNPGAAAVYDMTDIDPNVDAGGVSRGPLFVYGVEGSRWSELTDTPACDCRNLKPAWKAQQLPPDSPSAGNFSAKKLSSNCRLTTVGYAWDLAPLGIFDTVLTIPPGKSVEVNTVFSGVPNKVLEAGTVVNRRGVTINNTADYMLPNNGPDEMCDVSIKSPSANAIRVADYCTADHVDNVEAFVDPYPFNQYDLGHDQSKARFVKGTGHPRTEHLTQNYRGQWQEEMGTIDGQPAYRVCGSGCDPLGVLAGGHPFQFAAIEGPGTTVAAPLSGNDPRSKGTVYPPQTMLYTPHGVNTWSGGSWQASQIVSRANQPMDWMERRPRYSFATRTFTQIINWYMAEFQFALNQVGFWLEPSVRGLIADMTLDDDTTDFLCSWKIGERGADMIQLNAEVPVMAYPCINRSAFTDPDTNECTEVCDALLNHTMAASWGFKHDLDLDRAFSATGRSDDDSSNGFSRVKWGHEMLPTLIKATMEGPSCGDCFDPFHNKQTAGIRFHGEIDTSDENLRFLFNTGYTLDQANYEYGMGAFLGGEIPGITRGACSASHCSLNPSACYYQGCTPEQIEAMYNNSYTGGRDTKPGKNLKRKIDPGISGINWIRNIQSSGDEKSTYGLKPWVADGSPCYDNFCGPYTSTSDYDGCQTWARDIRFQEGFTQSNNFPCYLPYLGREPGANNINNIPPSSAHAQEKAGPDTPLMYVGFVAAAHDYRCGNKHYTGKLGHVELPNPGSGNFPVDGAVTGEYDSGKKRWTETDIVDKCWTETNEFGFDQRLPWKSAGDVLDAYATDHPVPYAIVQFWANSARSLPYDQGFPATGFNWTHVFPGLFVRNNYPEGNGRTFPAVMKRRYNSGTRVNLQAVWTTGARKQEEPMPCMQDKGEDQYDGIDNGGWQSCEVRTSFRLTPAMFTVPTLFRRDNYTWSYTFLGDDGLWAVPRPYRNHTNGGWTYTLREPVGPNCQSTHCMQVTKMVPGAEEVQNSFHCTHPDFKLHESDFINRNTEEFAAGAALTATGDPMIGVPLMLAGGIGFGKSMFNKAHQHKTCYRTTSYSHSSAVEMTAVTERTYYLNPRIESAMGTPDERAAFGLTEVQLERWCRVATTEAACNSKYRHYGCNWTGGICKLRPVPICHTWHDDYPTPNSTVDLEQCQPLDGFSPCVVIQQIYNESQGGNNKMLPVPGTGQYLTAHRVLGPYDQLLCVPLVHKVTIAATNYTEALREGLIYRKERNIDCSSIASIAQPEHATFCQEPLDFIDGPPPIGKFAHGIDYATSVSSSTRLQPYLEPFFFFDIADGGPDRWSIPDIQTAWSDKTTSTSQETIVYVMGTTKRNKTSLGMTAFDPNQVDISSLDQRYKVGFRAHGGFDVEIPTCSATTLFRVLSPGDPSYIDFDPTEIGLLGCGIAVDNVTKLPCHPKKEANKWPTSCTKPTLQMFTPDQVAPDGFKRTIAYPDRAWDDDGPQKRIRLPFFGSYFNLSSATYKQTEVQSVRDDGGWYFPHAHYCELAGDAFIGCDNDPLSFEARRELCTTGNAGLLYGGIEIMTIDNPCGDTTCYVFPGSNYGTVKSVAAYISENNLGGVATIAVVPYGWKVISEVLWEASYSNVTITNFPVDWFRLKGSSVVETGLGTAAASESDIVDGFCAGEGLGGGVFDQLAAAIDAMVVDGFVNMTATTSGSKTISFGPADVFPVLTEVGTKFILDGVELTSAVPSLPVTFRPATDDRCTVFDVEATDATFKNVVFDLSGCTATGIDSTPIVFSGTTGRGALVENITVVGGAGAAVAFVGRDTGAFLFSPEIGVSGAVVRDVRRQGGSPYILAAFGAAVEDAIVGTLDVASCPDWPLVGNAVQASAFGRLTLESGKLVLASGRCLAIESGIIKVADGPNCSYWWGTNGGGVHPWGAPVLCPRTFGDSVVAAFCEDCAIGSQALVTDDRPRVRQWDNGVTLTPDGMCVDVNGGVGPCDPAALYAATDRGLCNVARGISRFACAKNPNGGVAAVEGWAAGCDAVNESSPGCGDPTLGLTGTATAKVTCACVDWEPAAVADCGLSVTSVVSGDFANGTCTPTAFETVTTASIAAAMGLSCDDRCALFGGSCTGVTVSEADAVVVDGAEGGRAAVLACDGAVVERGYGWSDSESLNAREGVARVETVVIQPVRFAVFDVNLGAGIAVTNITDFTSDFGDAFEIAVRARPHTNDGSAAVVAWLVLSILLAELIIFFGLNYVDD